MIILEVTDIQGLKNGGRDRDIGQKSQVLAVLCLKTGLVLVLIILILELTHSIL